jgi:hypothetical protein
MRYTLNIESAYRTNNFRLNQNKNWVKSDSVYILGQTDFYTTNSVEIVNLQVQDATISIDGKNFKIHPQMGTELGNENQLHYEIYGFRQHYPIAPNENQLLQLILNGNDDLRNILVLKTDGLFYLFQQNQILEYVSNPEFVVQFEGFQSNNGYVGMAFDSNNIRNYIQNLFRVGVFHWVNHLKFKILHDQADLIIREENQVPEILELFDELHQIQFNWKPDY